MGPVTAATTAGVPRDVIRNVLRGQSPKYQNLLRICKALNLRLTMEPLDQAEPPATVPAPRPARTTARQSHASRRREAKEDVRAAYNTSAPRGEIVERLRDFPQDIVASVIDEMLNERNHEDAEELRGMATDAGHTIY